MKDWSTYTTAALPKPKKKPKPSQPATQLQLMARQQNWQLLRLKGALTAINNIKSEQTFARYSVITNYLNASSSFLADAIDELQKAHRAERLRLKDLQSLQQLLQAEE